MLVLSSEKLVSVKSFGSNICISCIACDLNEKTLSGVVRCLCSNNNLAVCLFFSSHFKIILAKVTVSIHYTRIFFEGQSNWFTFLVFRAPCTYAF